MHDIDHAKKETAIKEHVKFIIFLRRSDTRDVRVQCATTSNRFREEVSSMFTNKIYKFIVSDL